MDFASRFESRSLFALPVQRRLCVMGLVHCALAICSASPTTAATSTAASPQIAWLWPKSVNQTASSEEASGTTQQSEQETSAEELSQLEPEIPESSETQVETGIDSASPNTSLTPPPVPILPNANEIAWQREVILILLMGVMGIGCTILAFLGFWMLGQNNPSPDPEPRTLPTPTTDSDESIDDLPT